MKRETAVRSYADGFALGVEPTPTANATPKASGATPRGWYAEDATPRAALGIAYADGFSGLCRG